MISTRRSDLLDAAAVCRSTAPYFRPSKNCHCCRVSHCDREEPPRGQERDHFLEDRRRTDTVDGRTGALQIAVTRSSVPEESGLNAQHRFLILLLLLGWQESIRLPNQAGHWTNSLIQPCSSINQSINHSINQLINLLPPPPHPLYLPFPPHLLLLLVMQVSAGPCHASTWWRARV